MSGARVLLLYERDEAVERQVIECRLLKLEP